MLPCPQAYNGARFAVGPDGVLTGDYAYVARNLIRRNPGSLDSGYQNAGRCITRATHVTLSGGYSVPLTRTSNPRWHYGTHCFTPPNALPLSWADAVVDLSSCVTSYQSV
jgi:hypothetical protein